MGTCSSQQLEVTISDDIKTMPHLRFCCTTLLHDKITGMTGRVVQSFKLTVAQLFFGTELCIVLSNFVVAMLNADWSVLVNVYVLAQCK